MKKTNTLIGVLLLLVPFVSHSQFLTDRMLFTAKLDGSFIDTSMADSDAHGVATLVLNGTMDTICVNITIVGLTDSITGVGIYDGTTASDSVATDLSPSLNGTRVATSLTGLNVTNQRITKYIKGDYSIIVTTESNPDGIIGGQIKLETDVSFFAVLNGANEVPPTASIGYGLAVLELKMDTGYMRVNVVAQGLTDAITGAHLHFGLPGNTGGVAVDLVPFISGNTVTGKVDGADVAAVLDSLMAGQLYINLHTSTYPDGEIRGQVVSDDGIAFHSVLTGDNEIPPVTTDGYGVAHVTVNPTFDTLSVHVVVDGLSGAISGAHFHFGDANEEGGVIVDLTDSVDGFQINKTISVSSFSDSLFRNMLEGNVYLNVHTTLNPDGEVRDQVRRYHYEGYTYSMDGGQEEPGVTTNGAGSGFASIGPKRDLLHFMFAASGLSSPVSAAHFHLGAAGDEGSPIFTLTDFVIQNADTATDETFVFGEGFWSEDDADPFDPALVSTFSNDSIYINIHTNNEPDGEIRGQVLHGSGCFDLTTGIGNVEVPLGVMYVYPNPVPDVATLQLEINQSLNGKLELRDVSGKLLWFRDVSWSSGIHYQTLDMKDYSPGLYLFVIKDKEGRSLVTKIEKM